MAELDRDLLVSRFDEGTLPNGCIGPTDVAGWARALESLRASDWRIENVPGDTAALGGLFDANAERPTIKVFVDDRKIQINVFPLEPTSIDFDFAIQEMVDQDAVDLLVFFIRTLARAAGADCELTHEGSSADVVGRYGHEVDRFAIIGDGQGRLDDAVWNRAALRIRDEVHGPGDHALSAALLAHGLISNGCVAHAVFDAMVAPEVEASIAGFRYLGLNQAASVIEAATALSWSDSDETLGRLDRSYGFAIPSDAQVAEAAALRNATSDGAFVP